MSNSFAISLYYVAFKWGSTSAPVHRPKRGQAQSTGLRVTSSRLEFINDLDGCFPVESNRYASFEVPGNVGALLSDCHKRANREHDVNFKRRAAGRHINHSRNELSPV